MSRQSDTNPSLWTNFSLDLQVFCCSQNSPEWLILQKQDSLSSPGSWTHLPFPLHNFSMQLPLQAHADGLGSHLPSFNSGKLHSHIVPPSAWMHVSYLVHPEICYCFFKMRFHDKPVLLSIVHLSLQLFNSLKLFSLSHVWHFISPSKKVWKILNLVTHS